MNVLIILLILLSPIILFYITFFMVGLIQGIRRLLRGDFKK
jgi:hypothetical protein